jgi:hypothetical protein
MLHKLAVSYLRSQLQPALWTEGTKYRSKASHLVRPLQMAHKTKKSGKKKLSRCLPPKLSGKRGNTLPHKAPTKCQYQDWTPKE